MAGRELDADTRYDYQAALDAYEQEVHYIRYGELNVPYWEVGDPNEPYRFGWFDSGGARAVAMNLRLKHLGLDAGRGRRDPGMLRRKRRP
ncbi:hypothetical protein [Kribbella sp. NPDC051620]|uniref:hypothetical protein n=1 Tax=Kribbella sp. NPDC051620 TaxID=3364120 RepID=UPI00379C4DF1